MKAHKHKTVVITGGTRGIGAVIAKEFARSNYTVFVGARNAPVPDEFQDIQFVKMNVRYRNDHFKIVRQAIKKTGGLDVWVNCAGVSIWKPLQEINQDFWNEIMDTNAAATLWGSQAAASRMKPGSAIVNISSLAGKRGSTNNSAYCASKFAVNGITQALAKELGPDGIRVNALCPVYVETKMIHEQLKNPFSPSGGKTVDSYLKDFAKSNAALLRLPLAQEVARVCLFLASEQASAITGQCINVDCGVLPQ